MSEVRERMAWEELGPAARSLAEEIAADGWRPDAVLSIARGGLLIGAALAYALDVKTMLTLNVEFYAGVGERLPEPVILPPVPDLAGLERARVLVADDVADSGGTLELVRRFLDGRVGGVRTAVLYEKPWTTVACEHVWRRTDRWIDFPWSADAPVVAVTA